MNSIATLLLVRTHTVVLDADRIASAATRPIRDADVDRLEAVLLARGCVLGLDLAMTLRRMPYEVLAELERWMTDALGTGPIGRPPPYACSIAAHLHVPQPCPWCAEVKMVGALDPCGHLVCRECWRAGTFAGCPLCHRRVAVDPFLPLPAERRDGTLHLLHLALDLAGVARARFERLLAREAALSPDDRAELELVIDTVGPTAAMWLPKRIPVRESMAIALARLWLVAPDRVAMMQATQAHLHTATDVLRIAAVLMNGNAALVEPMRLASIPRGMRRALLGALETLPADALREGMRRHRGLWKRVGERLHPGESELPKVTAAFAALRGAEKQPTWGGRVERALAAGDARTAATLLVQRPGELLRRAGHLVRVATARQSDAIAEVHAALDIVARDGEPAAVLRLAVTSTDAAIVAIARDALVTRTAARRPFARAVIDRGLSDFLWNAAAIHAAVRANTIYVRDTDAITIYKRRDAESNLARLARLHAGEHDGVAKIPPANAPTWFALVRDDLTLPRGSEGHIVDAPAARSDGVTRIAAADLVAGLG